MGTDNVILTGGMLFMDNEAIGSVSEVSFDTDYDYTEIVDSPVFTLRKPSSFECELEATCSSINVPLLKELVGTMPKPQPFYMEFNGVRYEQIRKHKKRRINKKWAKRYGYRVVPCWYRMENCYIRQEHFNDWSIVSDPAKVVVNDLTK